MIEYFFPVFVILTFVLTEFFYWKLTTKKNIKELGYYFSKLFCICIGGICSLFLISLGICFYLIVKNFNNDVNQVYTFVSNPWFIGIVLLIIFIVVNAEYRKFLDNKERVKFK